ncbi:MAG: TIGR02147 family protein [Bdellovibrionota bacterium]|nr:TIGR02147 family protein [Bdellovibrionota bacterium]
MQTTDYRTFLFEELESRKLRNSSYSLRSFAESIGLPPSRLSRVLSRKAGLSAKSAKEISFRLGLELKQRELFITLVEAEHARSPVIKMSAIEKIKKWQSSEEHKFELEKFSVIKNWYYFSILELTELDDFNSSHEWIAFKLGIDVKLVSEAIEKLIKLNLLQLSNNRLVQTYKELNTPSGVPSKDLREHHRQIMIKTIDKIDKVPLEERCLNSTTMAIDTAKIKEAKAYIKEFRDKFTKEIQDSDKKNSVYCLSIQFFPMLEGKDDDS